MFLSIKEIFSDILEALLCPKSLPKLDFFWRNSFGEMISSSNPLQNCFDLNLISELLDTINVDKSVLNIDEHVLEYKGDIFRHFGISFVPKILAKTRFHLAEFLRRNDFLFKIILIWTWFLNCWDTINVDKSVLNIDEHVLEYKRDLFRHFGSSFVPSSSPRAIVDLTEWFN